MEGLQRLGPLPIMSLPACTQLSLILVLLGPASMGAHVPVPMTMCPTTVLALWPSQGRTVAQVRGPRGPGVEPFWEAGRVATESRLGWVVPAWGKGPAWVLWEHCVTCREML